MTRRTVHFASLGCPKNRVDTERMVALAQRQGLSFETDPATSDVIVVNTCGFIEAAKQESIDTILQMAEHKQSGRCQSLIVAGCLSQRYPDELARELPEVDHFLGTADLGRLDRIFAAEEAQRVGRVEVGAPEGLDEQRFERRLIGPPHSAYIKISEGCNRPCAFCSIPLMRGRQRSRTIESLVDEARHLVGQGTRELILVAQDTTAYGRDLGTETRLTELLRAFDGIEELTWIRVHYAYPSMVSADLCATMADLPRVVHYLDLPIQHIDDQLLRRMRRGYGAAHVRQALAHLREAMPDVAIRTTFLCGHPGETPEAHQQLLRFVEEAELDHVGCFVFSPEEGTPAAEQPDPVDAALGAERVAEVMALQQSISHRKLKGLRGRRLEVMVDGPSRDSELLLEGRTAAQSPEIDGVVTLTDGTARPGEVVDATITDSADYDLVATLSQRS